MGRFSFCCPFSDGNKDSNRAIPQNRYTYGLLALCGYVEYVLHSGKGFLTLSLFDLRPVVPMPIVRSKKNM